MMILFLLPFFQYLNSSIYTPNNSKYQILLLVDSPLCLNCLIQVDSILIDIDSIKFDYFVVPNENSDYLSRKIAVINLKKKIKAFKYLFFKDKLEFYNFCDIYKIKYFPTILFIKEQEVKILKYEDIFFNNISLFKINELIFNLIMKKEE